MYAADVYVTERITGDKMKIFFYIILGITFIFINLIMIIEDNKAQMNTFSLIDEKGNIKEEINPQDIFKQVDSSFLKQNIKSDTVNFDLLSKTAQNALNYLNTREKDDPLIFQDGVLGALGITVKDVKNTLSFIINTVEKDKKNNTKSRLLNADFIKDNFKIIQWYAYGSEKYKIKTPDKNIRLTKYVVYTINGSKVKTDNFDCALYSIPTDETGLTVSEAEAKKDSLLRYKYTKQQVLSGVYEKGGEAEGKVTSIAWLTREGIEEAIMEGTVNVKFDDGSFGIFNVHRNNGILYDRSIKEPKLQKRYWYFKKVNGIKGYGKEIDAKINIYPRVTFAGDVYNIGLGKFILLKYPSDKFIYGILADTGGAFIPNLYQLDFLSGVFNSKKEFINYVSTLPEYAEAYILIKS